MAHSCGLVFKVVDVAECATAMKYVCRVDAHRVVVGA